MQRFNRCRYSCWILFKGKLFPGFPGFGLSSAERQHGKGAPSVSD
jgi:hypothetical protein